jgi:hypothetical protein
MSEPLAQRRSEIVPRPAARPAAVPAGAPLPARQDALRQAMSCLDRSGRRLSKGDAAQTDEVLNLLRAATAHLRQAVARNAAAPTGAE